MSAQAAPRAAVTVGTVQLEPPVGTETRAQCPVSQAAPGSGTLVTAQNSFHSLRDLSLFGTDVPGIDHVASFSVAP